MQLVQLKDLPSPKGEFIKGHLSGFKQPNKHQVIEQWSKEVGDLFTISLMGKQFLVSTNLAFNAEVLKRRPTKFTRFSKIKEIMEEMGIQGVFSAEGEQWKKHRKITAEALSLKNIRAFFPIIKTMTDRLKQRWEEKEVVDAQQEMMLYTIDITTNLAFGHDTNTLGSSNDVIQHELKKIFPMINKRMAAPIPLWRVIKSSKDKELDRALAVVENKVYEYINEAKKQLNEDAVLRDNPSNFLQAMLVEQEKHGKFSDREVFGNVFTMLLAGEDTTSNSIAWAIYYLAQHPEIVDGIRKEIESIGEIDSVEKLDQLEFTEKVANETFRVKPTTPTLMMSAIEDQEIEGVHIPKGTNVLMQLQVAQMDESNFGCPEEFKPERWDAKSSGCPVHGNHNPDALKLFGGGARFCPGKMLAVYEMKMALAMICSNFDIGFETSSEDVNEVAAFTMYPENFNLKITQRAVEVV